MIYYLLVILRKTRFASITQTFSTTLDAKATYIPPFPCSGWDKKSLPPSHKHFLYTAAEVQRNSPLQRKAQGQDLDLFQCYLLQDLSKTPLMLDNFGS